MAKTGFNTLASIVMIMGFIAGLCGCDLLADYLVTADGGSAASDPGHYPSTAIDIGLVAPLTGDYADSLGAPILNGFNLARDEIKLYQNIPVQINFIIEDDMGTVDGAVGAFGRLIEAGVPVILGPAISTQAKEAFPIAQENRVVAFSSLSSAAGLSGIGDYIFRSALAVDRLSPAGVRATHAQLGYGRAAMIYDDADVWSTSSNEYLTAALEEQGVEVLTTQTVQTGDVDFSGQLEAIMETEPDVLFVSALPPEMVKIMIQGRETGIGTQYIVSQMSMHEVELAGDAAEGAITVVGWHIDDPANLHFVDSYRAAYGIDPDPWAAQAYAAFFILYAAIVEAESMDATSIRDALALTKDFDTNLGSFSFDENGEAVYDPVVLVVKDGAFEMFDSSEMLQAIAMIGSASESGMTGTATFTQMGNRITLHVEIEGASPGLHAVHIHEYGDCSAPDGTSAGGHWNPTDAAHGKWGEGEFHLGDIGNINVGDDGTGSISLTTDLWEIGTGSDVDVVGRGIIVHAGADDFVSQPSGVGGAAVITD